MFVKMVNSKSYDSKYDPQVKKIEIVAPGVLIDHGDTDGTIFFYPWHTIEFVCGGSDEFEHELEQFRHLGVSE